MILREFKAAEIFSKTSPDIRYYGGKESGRCHWYKNLLSRLQRVKWLYERLYWIKPINKEPVENEYFRIERNLKAMINDTFREFKERNKDLNSTLVKRLDQNILVESNVARNKSFAPKSNNPVL